MTAITADNAAFAGWEVDFILDHVRMEVRAAAVSPGARLTGWKSSEIAYPAPTAKTHFSATFLLQYFKGWPPSRRLLQTAKETARSHCLVSGPLLYPI